MNLQAEAFQALGDPTRRMIFEKLKYGPLAVVDIADGLTVSRPAVSQHLKVLKSAKLISMKMEGTRCIYQVDMKGVMAMRNYLDKFWNVALKEFKRIAEQTELKNKK